MATELDPSAPLDYRLDAAYTPRLEAVYFVDDNLDANWQPDVYPEAAALAHRLGVQVLREWDGCGAPPRSRYLVRGGEHVSASRLTPP
jgi:hypothetical protein